MGKRSLHLLLRASVNLLEISIGPGAEVADEEVAFIAATCPLLQRANFACMKISNTGNDTVQAVPPRDPDRGMGMQVVFRLV
jgi:hypothetical protein